MSTRSKCVLHPALLALALGSVTGCAEDLQSSLGDDDGGDEAHGEGGDGGPQIENEDDGDVVRTTVDATGDAVWIYFDLESRTQVTVADPLTSDAWDLAFKRYDIATNGGVSGGGGMTVAIVEGDDLSVVTSEPSGPWLADAEDGDDANDDPDYVISGWYDYDFMTHVLSPKPLVYVVRTPEENAFVVQVVDYYDEAGSSGWMQIEWKPLD